MNAFFIKEKIIILAWLPSIQKNIIATLFNQKL